ncbi:MAG: aldehyde dehydrogenase [Nisaea sp.]|jgi:thiamine pyrophosphate-dependent acetolactate synthase large subunit-like protein|nr:aldehyde dehydrogenase [Nisaea sp.]OUX90923.1 MAG: aldehyde dehydrogenase [Candidatus Endolissoclinum sp. TMED26]|tara:strand:+ start:103 stop:702 length:600 start_codon:yes stop_codon:yes gene_type:complete
MSTLTLDRREVLKQLITVRNGALVVTGLGSPVWDLSSIDERDENFHLWAGMGLASVTGLGLAMAQPDKSVWVVTGDGEMLMGVGSFATIAAKAPRNLTVIVLDNEHYGETGMQATHTGLGVDLAGMAAAAGFAKTLTVRTENDVSELMAAVQNGPFPLFAALKVKADNLPKKLSPRDGVHIKNRFRIALLGEQEAMNTG